MRVGIPRLHNFRHRKVAVGGRAVGQAPQVRSALIARGLYCRMWPRDLGELLKITFQYLTLHIVHLGVVSRRTQFSRYSIPYTRNEMGLK